MLLRCVVCVLDSWEAEASVYSSTLLCTQEQQWWDTGASTQTWLGSKLNILTRYKLLIINLYHSFNCQMNINICNKLQWTIDNKGMISLDCLTDVPSGHSVQCFED